MPKRHQIPKIFVELHLTKLEKACMEMAEALGALRAVLELGKQPRKHKSPPGT